MFLKVFKRILQCIDRGISLVLKLCVAMIVVLIVYLSIPATITPLTTPHILHLQLSGKAVENHHVKSSLFDFVDDSAPIRNFTLVRIQKVLDLVSQDPYIKGIYLDLQRVQGLGFSSAVRLHRMLLNFQKETGKEVWTWGENYTQAQYLVASAAKHIGLHPLGSVQMKGFSMGTLYWGDFLKKWGIDVSVYKAGDFKNAPEPFTNARPSKDSLQMQKRILDTYAQQYQDTVMLARSLTDTAIASYFSWLREIPGGLSLAEKQKELQWVTDIAWKKDFEAKMLERMMIADGSVISWLDYLTMYDHSNMRESAPIAVISIEGRMIQSSLSRGFSVDAVLQQMDLLEKSSTTQVVIVRVNSPGGDVFIAERLRQGLLALQKAGKKVVISMGDYAASGGYWIATASDYIVAEPGTLTGSIGVFSLKPSVAPLLEKWNIGVGGYKTNDLARMDGFVTKPSEMEKHLQQHQVETIYRYFLSLVSQARHMSLQEVDRIAQGQVWLGVQAKDLGLVDALGGLEDTLTWVKQEYHLDAQAPVWYVPLVEQSFLENLIMQVGGQMQVLWNNMIEMWENKQNTSLNTVKRLLW